MLCSFDYSCPQSNLCVVGNGGLLINFKSVILKQGEPFSDGFSLCYIRFTWFLICFICYTCLEICFVLFDFVLLCLTCFEWMVELDIRSMLGFVWLLFCCRFKTLFLGVYVCACLCMHTHSLGMRTNTWCMHTHTCAQKHKFRVLTILCVLISFNPLFRFWVSRITYFTCLNW